MDRAERTDSTRYSGYRCFDTTLIQKHVRMESVTKRRTVSYLGTLTNIHFAILCVLTSAPATAPITQTIAISPKAPA